MIGQRCCQRTAANCEKGEDSSLDYMGKQPSGWSLNKGLPPKCPQYGKSHPKNPCPTKDTVCYNCHCRGHFGKFCFSKLVAVVSEEPPSDDTTEISDSTPRLFLDAVSHQSTSTNAWHICVTVNGNKVVFKIDTEAKVTAISKEVWWLLTSPNSYALVRYFVDQVNSL